MEEVLSPAQEETLEVVDIQFRPGQKIYYFDPDGERFVPGDHVIMDTARGLEFGLCVGGNHTIPAKDAIAPLRKIIRHATEQDEKPTVKTGHGRSGLTKFVCKNREARAGYAAGQRRMRL